MALLVITIDVSVDVLKSRKADLSKLPVQVHDAVMRIAPGAVSLDTTYFLDDDERGQANAYLEKHALPFHDYTVEALGEQCRKDDCTKHRGIGVRLDLSDYLRRRKIRFGEHSRSGVN